MTIFNYTLNYVDLIIAGIFLVFTIVGIARGMFITVVNFIRYIIGFTACVYCSNRFSQPLYDNVVRQKLIDSVNDKLVNSKDISQTIKNFNGFISDLPDTVVSTFALDKVSIKKTPDVAKLIVDDVLAPVALIAVKLAVFIAVFIVFFLVTGVIIQVIKKHIAKKKIKNKQNKKGASLLAYLDKILGGMFGLFKGAIVVFVFVSAMTALLCVVDSSNSEFLTKVDTSVLYNALLDFNPFNTITEGIL